MKEDFSVIEVSFEVANKVGGIYTVVTSKSKFMQKKFKQYLCIGPYYPAQAERRFEEDQLPECYQAAVQAVQSELGIRIHYGRWIIPGEPETFLIEFRPILSKENDFKYWLWKEFGVDSLNCPQDFAEPVVWSMCAGHLIQKLVEMKCCNGPVVCQFHEWLSGPGLLYLRKTVPHLKTVFTTHATVLGRTLATSGKDLSEIIAENKAKKILPDDLAVKYSVQSKHLTEKAAAHNAHVFTTISETTAMEAEELLGKKPDVLTYNGLDSEGYPLMEELSNLHIQMRNRLRRFVFRYFYPYYNIEVKKTLFVFISGRHEIANKGIDLFIDSLGKLNQQLRKETEDLILIALIMVPYLTSGRNVEMLKRMARFEQMDDLIEAQLPSIKEKIMSAIGSGKELKHATLLEKDFLFTLRTLNTKIKTKPGDLPPWSPFELAGGNEITQLLVKNNLFNQAEDKVKIIYYPDYLSTTDGVLGMEYNQLVVGCHLGVFPSNYEPWGYTPVETAALGLPTITTDIAGYGQWLLENVKKAKRKSVMVLPRHNKTYDQSAEELKELLHEFYHTTKKKRNSAKIEAKKISYLTDWKKLIKYYIEAYQLALKKE